MDEYWEKLIYETPYYYAVVILHPSKQIMWFEREWYGYSTWMKNVKKGMKEFVASYIKGLAEAEDNTTPGQSNTKRGSFLFLFSNVMSKLGCWYLGLAR